MMWIRYSPAARSGIGRSPVRPQPKDQPWYHVLVNGAEHVTYVAERNLEKDDLQTPISHPGVDYFFERFENGFYIPRRLSQ